MTKQSDNQNDVLESGKKNLADAQMERVIGGEEASVPYVGSPLKRCPICGSKTKCKCFDKK